MSIRFYKLAEEYGCFSNFYRVPVRVYGRTWKTSEHAYQAQKFYGHPDYEDVANATTPKEAANIGRDRKRPLRRDWESVKYKVMKEVVLAKFQQNPECKEKLLSTGNEHIAEHTANDSIWADGGDGSGMNLLGKILMEVREMLRNEQSV